MAVVRDPAFWRRFSKAVHLDEEQSTVSDAQSTSTGSSRPPLKQTDSWLARNKQKTRKIRIIGCAIAGSVLLIILALVFALLWLAKDGPFKQVPHTSTEYS